MKKKVLIFFVIVLIFSFSLKVLAQSSDGSAGTTPPASDPSTTTPASGASSTPASTTTPASTPTSASSVKPKPIIKPKPTAPAVTTVPILPTTLESPAEPAETTSPSNNTIMVVVGAIVALLGGVGIYGLNAQKNKNNDPCNAIKKQRDLKEKELADATNQFSLQQALVDKLKDGIDNKKDKVQEHLIKKGEEKVIGKLGNNTLSRAVQFAEKGKNIYDDLTVKYEKAQDVLSILKNRKAKLTSGLEALDSSYKQCILKVTNSSANLTEGISMGLFGGIKAPQTTALFLYKPKEKEILLAMKKRSFGKGKWNAVGGKLNEGESIKQALVRETQEEIGVIVNQADLVQVATLNFSFKDNTEWNQQAHIFFAEKWEGKPVETEEMNPKWYKLHSLPYGDMWVDDIHWLPLVLKGKKVNGSFVFNKAGDEILNMEIKQI